MTSFDEVLWFSPETSESYAEGILRQREFDTAPVVDDGRVIGSIERSGLGPTADRPLRDRMRTLDSSSLVSADSQLGLLLTWMCEEIFLFVVGGREILGVVTPADANKQGARAYFYMLVAGFEISLSQMLRAFFRNQDDAILLLSEAKQDAIRERLGSQRSSDTAADAISAFDFIDLLKVVRSTPALLARFEFTPKEWQDQVINHVNPLRNAVMHSARPLIDDRGTSLRHLVDLDLLLRRLSRAAQQDLQATGSPYARRVSARGLQGELSLGILPGRLFDG